MYGLCPKRLLLPRRGHPHPHPHPRPHPHPHPRPRTRDQDGTRHQDGLTLAGELDLGGSSGTWIDLPNDDDETDIKPKAWRLCIFFVLISLDWLAAGDFGPFAASVSARYPCGKCMWTHACPCAYKPSVAIVCHSVHCHRSALRTHDSVMEEVRQLRAISSETKRKEFSTRTGIFSAHFASEYILNDVVRDSTFDLAHVILMGLARYMLSWTLDILCPADFDFAALNRRKRQHRFGQGIKVSDLERSKNTTRGSAIKHQTKWRRDYALHPCVVRAAPCVCIMSCDHELRSNLACSALRS